MQLDAKNPQAAVAILTDGIKSVDSWKARAEALAVARHNLYFAIATIQRSQKNFSAAMDALQLAQQNSRQGDNKVFKAAIAVSQEAFAARQWDAARSVLNTLKDKWGLPRKAYLLNLVQIEIADQKWAVAKTMLDEIVTLNPTDQERTIVAQLRAKLPAGT
jgi:hypothetical protein